MASDVTVVGMGNILYGDEGVGVYAAHYLRDAFAFDPEIEVLDGATMGFAITDLFREGARLLVLDALLAKAPAGTVYRLPTAELLDLGSEVTPTAHEVEPVQLLRQASALDVGLDLTLVGVVPQDASQLRVGLTPEVRAAFPTFVDAAVAELRRWGIGVARVASPSVDDVVGSLVEGVR